MWRETVGKSTRTKISQLAAGDFISQLQWAQESGTKATKAHPQLHLQSLHTTAVNDSHVRETLEEMTVMWQKLEGKQQPQDNETAVPQQMTQTSM